MSSTSARFCVISACSPSGDAPGSIGAGGVGESGGILLVRGTGVVWRAFEPMLLPAGADWRKSAGDDNVDGAVPGCLRRLSGVLGVPYKPDELERLDEEEEVLLETL